MYGSVRAILVNPNYVGDLVWNRRTCGKFFKITASGAINRPLHECGLKTPNSSEDWFISKDAHEPLVSRQVFEHAQQIRRASSIVRRRSSPDYQRDESDFRARYILTGLLHCARCGQSFWGYGMTRFYTQRRAKPYRLRLYCCRNVRDPASKNCPNSLVRQRVLERTISRRVVRWYADYLALDGRTEIRDAARDQCLQFAQATSPRLSYVVSEAEVKAMEQNVLHFIANLPANLKHPHLQTRRLTYRRCVEKIRLDLPARRMAIWVRRLPIFGATAGGTVRITARLPKDRRLLVMCAKKRLRDNQPQYSLDWHLAHKPALVRELVYAARNFLTSLGPCVTESMHQKYMAYSVRKHFACMKMTRTCIKIYLKLNPSELVEPPPFWRDVTNIGTQATGRVELEIQSMADLALAKPLVQQAYERNRSAAATIGPLPATKPQNNGAISFGG